MSFRSLSLSQWMHWAVLDWDWTVAINSSRHVHGARSVKFGSPPRRKTAPLHTNPSSQEYDTESIRKGVYSLSTKTRPAGVKFTTGPRTYNDAEERERASKPGPCTYTTRSSMGFQINSRYKSQPSVSFGARWFTPNGKQSHHGSGCKDPK